MNENWILKNGGETIPCASFPFAFRTMYNIVRKASEQKNGQVASVIKGLSIKGPPNLRGDRKDYSYREASELATEQGLLTVDGTINGGAMKMDKRFSSSR